MNQSNKKTLLKQYWKSDKNIFFQKIANKKNIFNVGFNLCTGKKVHEPA